MTTARRADPPRSPLAASGSRRWSRSKRTAAPCVFDFLNISFRVRRLLRPTTPIPADPARGAETAGIDERNKLAPRQKKALLDEARANTGSP